MELLLTVWPRQSSASSRPGYGCVLLPLSFEVMRNLDNNMPVWVEASQLSGCCMVASGELRASAQSLKAVKEAKPIVVLSL